MRVKMTLCSDAIFGSGVSVPGGEDIALFVDTKGFPCYKATAFKGVFREEAENFLFWEGKNDQQIEEWLNLRLGKSGDNDFEAPFKIRFSDMCLSDCVKEEVEKWVGEDPNQVTRLFSYTRTFTALDSDGMVKYGSLRSCRCLKKDLIFYGTIECRQEDEKIVKQILSCMKWIGTMRNRGFGRVRIEKGAQ